VLTARLRPRPWRLFTSSPGLRRYRGRARGSCWLQTSTSPGRKVPGPSSATEGVLVRRTPHTFDEVAVETDLAPRGDGDTAALVERGWVRRGARQRTPEAWSQSRRGRKRRRREVQRGGAPRSRLRQDRAGPRSGPFGEPRRSRQRPKLEVRRQAKLHLDDSPVTRTEGPQRPSAARRKPTVSPRSKLARRRPTDHDRGRDQESNGPRVLVKEVGCRRR